MSDLAKKKPASPSVGVPVVKLPVAHRYRRPSSSGSNSDSKGRRHRKGSSSSGSSSDKRRRHGKKGSSSSGSSSDHKSGGHKYNGGPKPIPLPKPIVKLPVPVVKETKY